ncbi:uncharacterized protein K460DRAFT_396118 [Cucurbitaria berberidis CBS 394.84]|uniref:Uncharacterized protein n=1 Tax=Cucurbitaria berberidis CBS 394.84 TaxID=1168544 RepID=A0A9P4GJY0_9PLEO|nr:uncharacterized protein K460DRAFT_396118 [Cucurbitaria berberidis CBS 394.84]KAF1846809.1 hypothetical protein K460DRAFT_396118 [Cucurbitaria berberidis CBS 394.84]
MSLPWANPRFLLGSTDQNRRTQFWVASLVSLHPPLPTSMPIDDYLRNTNACDFKLPCSDDQIRAETQEGPPRYELPEEDDSFLVVRRYLYELLTRSGWGVSDRYPVAVRCTVNNWIGKGGYFKKMYCTMDGLNTICPRCGMDDKGIEVAFESSIRDTITACIVYETRKLWEYKLHRVSKASIASEYLAIVAEEQQNLTATKRTAHLSPTDCLRPEVTSDQQSLHSDDQSVYSRHEMNNVGDHIPPRSFSLRHHPFLSRDRKLPSPYKGVSTYDLRSSTPAQRPASRARCWTTESLQRSISRMSSFNQRLQSSRVTSPEELKPHFKPQTELDGEINVVRFDDTGPEPVSLATNCRAVHVKPHRKVAWDPTHSLSPMASRPFSPLAFFKTRLAGKEPPSSAPTPPDDPKAKSSGDAQIKKRKSFQSRLAEATTVGYYGRHEVNRRRYVTCNAGRRDAVSVYQPTGMIQYSTSSTSTRVKVSSQPSLNPVSELGEELRDLATARPSQRSSNVARVAPDTKISSDSTTPITAAGKEAVELDFGEVKTLNYHAKPPTPKRRFLVRRIGKIFGKIGQRKK